MRDHMTPQAHYKHNTLIHRHTSSQQTQDRKATNYSTRWHQTPEMKMFSSLWVRLNSPDTFIENEEFVICQAFLLEDCDDSIVDAAAPNTQKPFLTLLSHMYFNTICLALDIIWCTCSRWRWLLPSSASPLCPPVNFSHSFQARWGWGSSSAWAGAESSWERYRADGNKREYALLSTGQERNKVRLWADIQRRRKKTGSR